MKALSILAFILFASSCSNMQVKKQEETVLDNNFYEPLTKSDGNEIQKLSKEDYVQYIINPVNGLVVSKQVSNFDFSILYKPNPFVALVNLSPDPIIEENYNKEVSDLKDLQYFTFKITAKDYTGELLKYNLKSMEEYDWRVNYYSFKMQNDIKLIEGNDTLDCSLFHFERNFGVAPNLSFVLGFPNSENEKLVYNKTISFEDKVFGIGKVNVTINKENIINIPGLKIN